MLSDARALLEESCASSIAVAATTPEQRAAMQLASGGSQVQGWWSELLCGLWDRRLAVYMISKWLLFRGAVWGRF